MPSPTLEMEPGSTKTYNARLRKQRPSFHSQRSSDRNSLPQSGFKTGADVEGFCDMKGHEQFSDSSRLMRASRLLS
ncbi:hypothetical protein XA68_13548 [Ophiocordyceps unilateralis]|uniref:Uncharacterized protein n=1 Tax=Ophiocordyceps unilateralis TaxID=268505 RepID=A0A2A9PC97_OPHUN|nr:hypothetical protein XA68_13548 [Ophiocordyceps unilateralis]